VITMAAAPEFARGAWLEADESLENDDDPNDDMTQKLTLTLMMMVKPSIVRSTM